MIQRRTFNCRSKLQRPGKNVQQLRWSEYNGHEPIPVQKYPILQHSIFNNHSAAELEYSIRMQHGRAKKFDSKLSRNLTSYTWSSQLSSQTHRSIGYGKEKINVSTTNTLLWGKNSKVLNIPIALKTMGGTFVWNGQKLKRIRHID